MLNIKDIYDNVVLNESKSKRLYDNGDITFADIRDIVQDTFKDGGTVLQKNVPGIELLVTYKDGEFCVVAAGEDIESPKSYDKFNAKCCNAGKDVEKVVVQTIEGVVKALKEIDPVLLNKFFANGQNYALCNVVFPPEDLCDAYGRKCYIQFKSIKSYGSDFKEVGEDVESTKELRDLLKASQCLDNDACLASDECIQKLQKCESGKKVVEKILSKLSQFIDGVGWGCSLSSYIQDKYSRYIINKALEHHLDVSRSSTFVNELVQRLIGAKMRPTKSDLVCFAKREGIDCTSEDYKSFLEDIESSAEQMCKEIVNPIEDMIYYIVDAAVKNLVGFISADPRSKAKKLLSQLDAADSSNVSESDGEGLCKWSFDKLEPLKKCISKICYYVDNEMPKNGLVIVYKGVPYKVLSKLGKLDRICRMIGC